MRRRHAPLLSGAVLPSHLTAAERSMGRLMRAPDGHPTPTPTPTPTPSAFDFPQSVADINVVPEPARPLYVKQQDGSYKYDDISALRSALDHEKNNRKSIAEQLESAKPFLALGKTPEEIKALLDAQAAQEQNKLREAGDFEALKQQMEQNHQQQVGTLESKMGNYRKQIEKMLVSDQAQQVLGHADIQGNPLLLMPIIRDRVEVKEKDDGSFTLVVKNAQGQPMLNANNEPATMMDLAKELRKDSNYAAAFKGVNQSGGGAPNGSGPGGSPNGLSRSKMSVREKSAFIREHGQQAYNELPN